MEKHPEGVWKETGNRRRNHGEHGEKPRRSRRKGAGKTPDEALKKTRQKAWKSHRERLWKRHWKAPWRSTALLRSPPQNAPASNSVIPVRRPSFPFLSFASLSFRPPFPSFPSFHPLFPVFSSCSPAFMHEHGPAGHQEPPRGAAFVKGWSMERPRAAARRPGPLRGVSVGALSGPRCRRIRRGPSSGDAPP